MDYNKSTVPPLANSHVDYLIEIIASALTTYYTPTLILLGIIGNALSIFIFYTSKLKVQSTSLYLSALAASDSIFLLQLLPPWLNAMGITNLFHRRGFCQVFVYTSYSSCCLSAWLIVAFTIERYVAVLYPLRRNRMCTRARAKSVIGLLTLFALIINAPVIKYASHSTNDCNIDLEYVEYAEKFNVADTIVSFSLPLVIVVVLNIRITSGVWRQQRAALTAQAVCPELGAERMQRALPLRSSQHRVTRMLLIVSTVYVVLNLPAYTMRLLAYIYDMSSSPYYGRWAAVNEIALAFFNTNFGINFLVYCLNGQNFQRELCRSIPWLRNIIDIVDDIPLVNVNARRAGSVSALALILMNPRNGYVLPQEWRDYNTVRNCVRPRRRYSSYLSTTEVNASAAVETLGQRRNRERRQRAGLATEHRVDIWSYNRRMHHAQALRPSGQPDVLVHAQPHVAPHAHEEIEMQDLAPAMPGRVAELRAPAPAMPAPAPEMPAAAPAMPAAAPAMPAPAPAMPAPGPAI